MVTSVVVTSREINLQSSLSQLLRQGNIQSILAHTLSLPAQVNVKKI
jgi:hypothetical protein